ncbi:c-type cytochrome [Pedobacter metabolipauper]|uniref:Cytochrome c n=1 Tax=Pedobacter metabolipauper TaxID=425513 RepID=A0A4R6STJ6_9SPHI|nr:c-type cytochrome [Pedobacter metabolipauper]TDQ06946.1 cytochrome c [Pedobacter metabolipauper]
MKKIFKVLLIIVLLLILLIGISMGYVKWGLPNAEKAPDLKVEITPERIARGEYIANHVTLCVDCHSTRDWSKFAGPPKPGTLGKGGEVFDENAGFPGAVYSKNITPFNLKGWTDGELYRLITTGVTKDGKAMMNIMPYPAYSKMDPEDVYDIIAYLRTLKPIPSTIPERRLDFPLNFIVNTIPGKAMPQKKPAASDTLKYGAYLLNAAACVDCHTKQDKGNNIKGMEFAGGREFASPAGSLYSTNITSDKTTGIGNWTKEMFVSRFKVYADSNSIHTVKPGDFQTIMPWVMYSGMKESDLAAIYTYLKTIKPIPNKVTRFVPAKKG